MVPPEPPHLCSRMAVALREPDYPIVYHDTFREYGLQIQDGGPSTYELVYCPFCGERLPSSVRDRWFDALEAQGPDVDSPDLPAAFTTGAWWRDPEQVGAPDVPRTTSTTPGSPEPADVLDHLDLVQDMTTLARFVGALRSEQDFKGLSAAAYLEQGEALLHDHRPGVLDAGLAGIGPDSWKLVAQILLSAALYE